MERHETIRRGHEMGRSTVYRPLWKGRTKRMIKQYLISPSPLYNKEYG